MLYRIARLRRLIRDDRPDLAVGFMHSAYVSLAMALEGGGLPAVASEHIVYSHYRRRPVQRALLRLAAPAFQSITAVSEAMRASFPEVLRRRMTVVPNPVRSERPAATMSRSKGKTLLTVGRLEPQKDQAVLVEAFARVMTAYPEWTLRTRRARQRRYKAIVCSALCRHEKSFNRCAPSARSLALANGSA